MTYLLPHLRGGCVVAEGLSGLLGLPNAVSVVRALTLQRAAWAEGRGHIELHVADVDRPLQIDPSRMISFGHGPNESVSAFEYIRRVIERGDLIDVAVAPGRPYILDSFWISIIYENGPFTSFVRKDDGLFAYRGKSGEKAERRAARELKNASGHPFSDEILQSPGPFTIRYANKKRRKPDLCCPRCNITFEVKKRNGDRRYRISHSRSRLFTGENHTHGWHAFVFPNYDIHYIPNEIIIKAINSGHARLWRDKYDSYAEIDQSVVHPSPPPPCSAVPW